MNSLLKRLIPQGMKQNLKHAFASELEFTLWGKKSFFSTYLPYKRDMDFISIPKDPPPTEEKDSNGLAIPPRELWASWADGGRTAEGYIEAGREHVENMKRALGESGFSLSGEMKVLDFGCAAGRMLRHLSECAEHGEAWGVDISAEHIYWCKQYLGAPFRFLTVTTGPHLPFEDRHFDLIYSGSVFTHIDDLAEAWLLELRRILRPGGRFYVTIHDSHTLQMFEEKRESLGVARHLLSLPEYQVAKQQGFKMMSHGRSLLSNVYYDRDYFREMVSPFFEIQSIAEGEYGYQTAVLLERL